VATFFARRFLFTASVVDLLSVLLLQICSALV
jgi:hypothetical protein